MPCEHLYLPAAVEKFEYEHYQYLFLSFGLGRLSHHKEPSLNRRLLDASPTLVTVSLSASSLEDTSGPFTFFTLGLLYF